MIWLLTIIAVLNALLLWRLIAESHATRSALHGQTNRLVAQLAHVEERLHSIDLHAAQLPKMRQPGEP